MESVKFVFSMAALVAFSHHSRLLLWLLFLRVVDFVDSFIEVVECRESCSFVCLHEAHNWWQSTWRLWQWLFLLKILFTNLFALFRKKSDLRASRADHPLICWLICFRLNSAKQSINCFKLYRMLLLIDLLVGSLIHIFSFNAWERVLLRWSEQPVPSSIFWRILFFLFLLIWLLLEPRDFFYRLWCKFGLTLAS